MKKQLKSVKQFHESFGVANGEKPSLISEDDYTLRYKLMAEEYDE